MLPVSLPFVVVRLLIGEDHVVGGLGCAIFTYEYRNKKKNENKRTS